MSGCVMLTFGVPAVVLHFRVLGAWREKLRGLWGTSPEASPVVLVGCPSIHTVGMRYALDVALVSREGVVLASEVALPPGRTCSARKAWYAFERPHKDAPWPEVGVHVAIVERG